MTNQNILPSRFYVGDIVTIIKNGYILQSTIMLLQWL